MVSLLCAHMGLNERFADEVLHVLSPFPRHTKSLMAAAFHCVAERHSVYIGRDELRTCAADMKRIRLSSRLLPQNPRNVHNYVNRLTARMVMSEFLHEVYLVLDRMQLYAPPMPLVDTACAALIVANENLDLSYLAFCVGITEQRIARIVAKALVMPLNEVTTVLTPAPNPRRRPRAPRPHVKPTIFEAPSTAGCERSGTTQAGAVAPA